MARAPKHPKSIEAYGHEEASRKNIPTAEMQGFQARAEQDAPIPKLTYARNTDLDPQLVWRGKDAQDARDLTVKVPPIYIQEKIHPKAIIDNLRKQTVKRETDASEAPDLFADFNGLDNDKARLEFYAHDQHWSNRMILGDSLQVMASLAERESLRGKVQCIYFDPPYGIKFGSNWQPSTKSRDVKDGKDGDLTREPEQIRAFRDTWKDGIHSYLSYLRDRLVLARDLLTDSGSIFVQIGEENVHFLRTILDELFGISNFQAQISFVKAGALGSIGLPRRLNYLLWFSKTTQFKYRKYLIQKRLDDLGQYTSVYDNFGIRTRSDHEKSNPTIIRDKLCRLVSFTKPGPGSRYPLLFEGKEYFPGNRWWGFTEDSSKRIIKSGRLMRQGKSVASLRFFGDYPVEELSNLWTDTASGSGMEKIYVVQTAEKVVQRLLLMATDPGDLVLDPTCGSGTTAAVAEQWGRRWITIDTSRVALALARQRIMAARYPYYLLTDSAKGAEKEGKLTRKLSARKRYTNNVREGFVYERAPHVTLKSIANNQEIDVLWAEHQETLEPLRVQLNDALTQSWEEWQIPREADPNWPSRAAEAHAAWWQARIERQRKIDASIARNADVEYLYDRPYEDKTKVRVAGPFTVESLSPHRAFALNEQDEPFDVLEASEARLKERKKVDNPTDFGEVVLRHLEMAGVSQADKQDRIEFTAVTPWMGDFVFADGRYLEGEGTDQEVERHAAIFVGPEFGTIQKLDLTAAAREAMDGGFDILIACGFAFDAMCADMRHLGRLKILRAKINPDLHMADSLKNTKAGNPFVVFGEPDMEIINGEDGSLRVKIHGMDVFDPSTGDVRASETKDIAAWFIDTDYDEASFFVRHAYFLGGNDPYGKLKTTLKAEIDQEAWETLYSDTSRPFERPASGRIAVKVINHFGDEVMKVFKV